MRVAIAFVGTFLFLGAPQSSAQTASTRQVPVDSLIYDLKNPDPVRRKEAANLLGVNKVQRAVPDLVSAASDADPAVRREIVLALDKLLDPRSIPAFVKLMSDPERDIREKCIHGVINLYLPQESGLGVTLMKVANFINPWSDEWSDTVVEPGVVIDRTVVDALRGRLEDFDEGIRVKAARALGILKGKEALPVMLDTLRRDRSNPVRFEVIRSLRKIGDTSVAKDLMNYLAYNESKVRNEAVFTLARFRHTDAVAELTSLYEKESKLPVKKMDKAYREFLLDALAFIAAPASKDLFIKEKKNPDDNLRLHAVEGLARIGDPALVTEISRDRLAEKEPRLRTAQAFALYRMGRKEYLDELVDALAKRRSHNEAKQYIVEFKPDELPDLYAQSKKNDVDTRESLAEIFGLVGDSAAIPVLQELNKDRRGQVSALANQALRRINARTAP
jgi:HEAT repeat protein